MTEHEWSTLDADIQRRLNFMTADEVALMEYKAKGGNVIAQTTLGLYWLADSNKAISSTESETSRNQDNASKARSWLRAAAVMSDPVRQAQWA